MIEISEEELNKIQNHFKMANWIEQQHNHIGKLRTYGKRFFGMKV